MELFLIRHAQSRNNALPESQRLCDPPLTELGRQQATWLAEWIETLQLSRLMTSPFRRALETTAPLAAATGLVPEVRTLLHEQGGCYSGYSPRALVGEPGMTRSEIQGAFPGYAIEPQLDGQGWWQRKGYESYDQARIRAQELLDCTHAEFAHSAERVAYVMHADIKMLLIQRFHEHPLDFPANTSVTHVEISPEQPRLNAYNLTDHLPPTAITH